MKLNILPALLILLLAASCDPGAKDKNAQINDKKVALAKLQDKKDKTDAEITALQEELSKIDTSVAANENRKLVATAPVQKQDFKHYIDLQGTVDAENSSYISPRGMGGQVKALYVKQGDRVRKGQLLLKMDDAIMRQQYAAVKQQQEGIKTQLSFAKNIYQRQKNLWDKGIGTEVQLITAKNNVESLEDQLRSSNEQIKISAEQLNTANVYSDVNGVADIVNVRVGEIFQGMGATGPQIKIVNTSSLKAMASIPENYIARVKQGTPVVITIPGLNRSFNSTVSRLSQAIDATQLGFVAEAKLPADAGLKPNQSLVMQLLDYNATNAVVIPVNTVQNDNTSKYVFVMQKEGDRIVAKKKNINIGTVYGNLVEVKTGLNGGEQLITEGFQDLYDGQSVTTGTE